MLKITIELIPFSDKRQTKTISVIDIVNDGTGSPEVGNYLVTAEGEIEDSWKTFIKNMPVKGVLRGDYLECVARCLNALIQTERKITPSRYDDLYFKGLEWLNNL